MLHLGSIFGTTIRVDVTFLILVALFVASSYDPNRGIHYALLWLPVLFISVLIHELAHAAMIAIFGHGSSDIVLGGMGGVTINKRRAAPWQDMLVSIAGPLANFALMWLTALIFVNVPYTRQDPMLLALLPILVFANKWWGILNLLPVSPLDGGHAVRNFLRTFLDDKVAFVIAVWVGIVVGVAVAILSVRAGEFFLAVLLAWFVYMNFQHWQYYREHGYPGD
jgi:Zn-dependent protease